MSENESRLIRLPVWHEVGEMLAVLSTHEWNTNPLSENHGRLTVTLKESENEGESILTYGFRSLRSEFDLYLTSKVGKEITHRLSGDCAFIFDGTYTSVSESGSYVAPFLVRMNDYEGTIVSAAGVTTFSSNNMARVRRINVPADPLAKVAEAEIMANSFKNLLNKSGRQSGVVGLLMKDNKLSAIIDPENANCVESYYKAGNVVTTSGTIGATVRYDDIYNFLYRRKAAYAGLLTRIGENYANEGWKFGILQNGRIFLEIPSGDPERSQKITIVMPQSEIDWHYEDLTVHTKTVRRSSRSVPVREPAPVVDEPTEAPVVLQEPTETTESTEQDTANQDMLDYWQSIHIESGGTSEDPKQWFASYTMYRIRQGLEIEPEALELASTL